MHGVEEPYTPTAMQSAIGEPLRSEQRTPEFLPRILSRVDLLVIFIIIVLFIPDGTVVQVTQQAGAAAYIYWLIGGFTFLLPGAIVTAQLARFIPAEGSIYVWTHRAFGSLWGFFAGICAWFPGVLVLLSTGEFAISLVQSIGVQLFGKQVMWLDSTWEQGVFVLLFLLLAGWFARFPLHVVMKVAKGIVLCYGLGILTVGLAGLVWLLSGHAPQTSFTPVQVGTGSQNVGLYGVIVLALLGVEVPMNMAAETRKKNNLTSFLRWGIPLVLLAYLIDTFGVMAVVKPGSDDPAFSTLAAVGNVFGAPSSVILGSIFIAFFFITTVVYNLAFARILFVAALDHRLPTTLAKVNRHRVPSRATHIQTLIVLLLAVLLYFVLPALYLKDGADFSARIYNVVNAATTVIWCISMIILFLDLPILLRRFRALLAKNPEHLIVPRWVLYLSSLVGILGSFVGIWATVSSSWDSSLISNAYWGIIVGSVVLLSLFLSLIGAAYPRLLSNLNEQTAVARENARLYDELRVAYEKLSELDALKNAFLSTASHELRTPLTIVQGYLELLTDIQDDTMTPELRMAFLQKARRACDELVLLQANIMDASTLDLDIIRLHYSSFKVDEVCTAVLDLFEPLIIQQGRTIELAVPKDIIVKADETRLKQILRNLIANALRYSLPRTPIRVIAAIDKEQQMVRIQVIDKGLGVPPDKQQLIFERFVRLERDMVGTVRGSGLGLAICRQLVEAMHGTIRVESSGIKGEGSIFSFTLPVEI